MSEQERVLLLTGASRGIGHATVKTFSDHGWRVLTISRHPFDPRCPWKGGERNHIQLDIASIESERDRGSALELLESDKRLFAGHEIRMAKRAPFRRFRQRKAQGPQLFEYPFR